MGGEKLAGREQIGPSGLAALLFGFLIGTTVILPMGAQAKQDAWIAILLAGVGGLGIAWLYTALARQFPGQSLVRYSKVLLGPWVGSLIGMLYAWYGLHLGSLVLRNFSEFMAVNLFPQTPPTVTSIALMLVCLYAVRLGLETLARASLVMAVIVVLQIAIDTLLLAKDMRPSYLLPVLGNGPIPVIQAAVSMIGFPFGETVLFAMILPGVRPVHRIRPTVMWAICVSAFALALISVDNTTVLSDDILRASLFPTYEAVRRIDVADFLTRVDAVLVTGWVLVSFTKISVCLYASVRALADTVGLCDDRPLFLPMGALMIALSLLLHRNVIEMVDFPRIWPFYSAPVQIFIPLLLLGVARFAGRRQACGGRDEWHSS